MEGTIETVTHYMTIYGMKIIAALVILILGRILAKWLGQLTQTAMIKRQVDPALQHFLSSLVFYALMAFVVIAALAQLGIQTASFIAVVGAAGLAIGLALQGALANFAAGFLILLLRPFRIGDYVEMAGTSGTVDKIMIVNTELTTPDNKKVIIPNGQITAGNIVNYSAFDTRRVDLVMSISYGDDIDRAKQVIEEVLAADERVLPEPAPNIRVSQLADNSVDIIVRPWSTTADYWGLYWDLTENLKKRFDQEGITIPFPQRELHLIQEKGA